MTPAVTHKDGTHDKTARRPAATRARAARRQVSLRPFQQGLGMGGCVGLLFGVCLLEYFAAPHRLPLFLFVSALAGLAVLLPVAGPRGLRVGLLPAVGLAGLLLLPPGMALLPILLANTAFAFSRQTPLSRHLAHERGAALLLALLAGGLCRFLAPGAVGSLLTAILYGAVFLGSRRALLERHFQPGRDGRRSALQGWRLEAATFAVSLPIALLMMSVFPAFGLLGLTGLAALLALLGVVAHLGFEAAGLRDQVQAMELLSAVTVSQTSAARVTTQFLHLSRGLVSCDRVTLWLTDETELRLKRTALKSNSGSKSSLESDAKLEATKAQSVRFGEGPAGQAAEQRRPLFVRGGAGEPGAAADASFAGLLVPLVAGNQTLGVIHFERVAPGIFTRRDLSRIRALASQAAATLANVRAHQDIYSQAVTDALTGLHNRRRMQTVLADECRRAQRYGHPLSVIMLDVDGFKSYNDTYGHVQGDALLRMLAGILQSTVRGVDSVGRFGGEEFVVVLPETPSGEAYQAAERLRLAVAGAVFPGYAGTPDTTVSKTISLGVATFPDLVEDAQALVTLADDALYRAKRGGRNQTVQAVPEVAVPAQDALQD